MTLPGGATWTYAYWANTQWGCMPKDDPNSATLGLQSILDDQGRRVDYTLSMTGKPISARYNQVYDTGTPPQVISYCQADYTFQRDANLNTQYWLGVIQNRYWYKDNNGNWQSRRLFQNDYSYDNASQRLTNAISDQNGPVRTETYGYDAINRLTTVNYGDGGTQSSAFDNMGNRLSKVNNGTPEAYTYNNANMLLTRGGNAYTNDANGNTLTGGGRTNTWDSQNRLVQCAFNGTTTTNTYASDGLRHRSVVGANTTDTILDQTMQVRELLNGAVKATYLVGPRGPEYRRDDQAGSIRWYVYDGLGSVVGEVHPSGNLTRTQTFDVYGAVRTTTGTATTKQKYVGSLGHPSDDETGLIYMRARHYDPVCGRFVSEDPAGEGANWFAYCDDNPASRVDADGKTGTDVAELFRSIRDQLEKAPSAKGSGALAFISTVLVVLLRATNHEKTAAVLTIVSAMIAVVLALAALVTVTGPVGAVFAVVWIAAMAATLYYACEDADKVLRDPEASW